MTQALVDVSQASETNHSKSSLGNFHHQYLPELLVNVYSYRLMVKCVLLLCVWKLNFLNLVTNTWSFTIYYVYRIINSYRGLMQNLH